MTKHLTRLHIASYSFASLVGVLGAAGVNDLGAGTTAAALGAIGLANGYYRLAARLT